MAGIYVNHLLPHPIERKFSAKQMLEYIWFMLAGVSTYSKGAP